MTIPANGWVFHMIRQSEQTRASDSKRRTVGTYRVLRDGVAQGGGLLAGMFAETRGPGANAPAGNNRRIEAGQYTLRTQGGAKYVTWGYSTSANSASIPRPGIELRGCAPRGEILIHPGRGFLSSVGCINPCTSLPNAMEMIEYVGSRERVIAILDDLRTYLGAAFPGQNEKPVPRAFVVIEGEPNP